MVRTLDTNQSFSSYHVCIDVTCILSVWSLFGFTIKVFVLFCFFRIVVSTLLIIHFYAPELPYLLNIPVQLY